MSHSTDTARSDRIGPNAVIQLITALKALGETEAMTLLFTQADRAAWLKVPPGEMIPASDAARLHIGLRDLIPAPRAEAALALAGQLDRRLPARQPHPRFRAKNPQAAAGAARRPGADARDLRQRLDFRGRRGFQLRLSKRSSTPGSSTIRFA